MAKWIRTVGLLNEMSPLNPAVASVVPLGKALYPHCLVPRRGLKTVGPLVAQSEVVHFLSDQVL